MFYEFNTTSLVIDFIQQLLASTPLPIYERIQTGDVILLGRYYIYDNNVIKCTKTGTFNPEAVSYVRNEANYILVPDGIITYEQYVPSSSYYSSKTHERLFRYISYLKASTGLNLFPFYNCYGGKEISGLKIDSFKKDPLTCGFDYVEGVTTNASDMSTWEKVVVGPSTTAGFTYLSELSGGYSAVENTTDRLVAIPVKFGHTYTIALECPSRVSGRCFFLNDSGTPLTFEDEYSNNIDPSSYLGTSIFQQGASQFTSPFVYTVPLIENISDSNLLQKLYAHEGSLYLVLQMPKSCNSSIAVLSGDFLSCVGEVSNKNISPDWYDRDENGNITRLPLNWEDTWSHIVTTPVPQATTKLIPRLLNYNTGISYAFTDRLVEYLTNNVINSEDPISGNIRRIQQVIETKDFQFGRYDKGLNTYGVWHTSLSQAVARFLDSVDYESWFRFDQDGNVNRDIEYLLARFGGYNG